MTARMLALLNLVPLFRPAPATSPAISRSRRKSARAAVGFGIVWFVFATLGLATAMETVKPRWRDPEFVCRVEQLRQWKATAPGRPVVMVFGSSRTQMAIAPSVMGFTDEPGSPLVYNCGYRGAHPLGVWLHLTRFLDEGPRPDFVLVQLATSEVGIPGSADRQLISWGPRLSPTDRERLSPYCDGSSALSRRWAVARLTGWVEHREPILSDLLPDWQPLLRRLDFTWERMDSFGWVPFPAETVSDKDRKRALAENRQKFVPATRGRPPGPISDRAYRDLIARCRAEGIPVAFFTAPESPAFRSWYSPAALKHEAAYRQSLLAEGVPVFPTSPDLAEEDFADGYHMLRLGAQKYSRWLAETHLKPWLASYGHK